MTVRNPIRSRRVPILPLLLFFAIAGGCSIWQATRTNPPTTPTSTAATAQTQPDQWRAYIYGGLPRTTQPLTLLKNTGYIVGYSEKRKDPAWVAQARIVAARTYVSQAA